MKIKDLKNKKFGKLLVVCNGGYKNGRSAWKCNCDCGNTVLVIGKDMLSGNTKSCGCLRKKGNKKHGLRYHPLYSKWIGMKNRCRNKKASNYKYYGGRGIEVCARWDDIKSFYDDMIETWEPGLTIDRINNDGNYEPDNCRWATRSVQMSNRRGFGSSKYKGVGFHKVTNKWQAYVKIKDKEIYLGLFSTEEEAHQAVLKETKDEPS